MSLATDAQRYSHADDELGLLNALEQISKLEAAWFTEATPFPHIVIDNLFNPAVINQIHEILPKLPVDSWDKSNDQGVEVKWRSNWRSEYDIPEPAREVVRFLNSGPVLRELSRLTGIPNLIADPYYTGGGFNYLRRGGYLDVHVDGNWHDAMRVHRRLNLIVYLNSNWRDEWGGELNFYDSKGENVVTSVAPHGNRTVIFETHDLSYHGHPDPLMCPEDQARTSIILYYYTSAPRPDSQIVVDEPHSALWRSKGWTDKRGNKTRV